MWSDCAGECPFRGELGSALALVVQTRPDLRASISPPTFYASGGQVEAADSIKECLRNHTGLIVVTGETGTGKTLLLRRIINTLTTDILPVFFYYSPNDIDEFVDYLSEKLYLNHYPSTDRKSGPKKIESLQKYFRQQQRRRRPLAVFIDDAHNLSEMLLTSILVMIRPPVQLTLIGLPTLVGILRKPGLQELLPQSHSHIEIPPLTREEATALIALKHESQAGFSPQAIAKIVSYSHGIPRLINMLCECAIIIASSGNGRMVTEEIVGEAAQSCDFALEIDLKEAASDVRMDHFSDEGSVSGALVSLSNELANRSSNNLSKTELICSLRKEEQPMYRTESINKALKNLQSGSPDVEAAALISEDGLMIASVLPQDLDETRVAGMSATLLSLGTRAAAELGRGDVQEVVVRGNQGYSVMVNVGRGVLLLVVANENAKLGLIFFDMREAANALRQIL